MHSELQHVHQRVLTRLSRQFERRIMDNVLRGQYLECLVAELIGPEWALTWELEKDWCAWDLEHQEHDVRVEIKQSAARQAWHDKIPSKTATPRFSVKQPKQSWNGAKMVDVEPGTHLADIYTFAWHGESKSGVADHRNSTQWRFYVIASKQLPEAQSSVGLAVLDKLRKPVRGAELADALNATCKSVLEQRQAECQ